MCALVIGVQTCALPISSYATSADVGDATVAVAGTVAGNAESSTTRGKATTTVTGTIGGDAVATAAYGNDYQSSSTTDYAGKVAASGSTSFGSLVPKVSKQVSSSTSNNVGGAASILVDTARHLPNPDKIVVSGSVYSTALSPAQEPTATCSKVNDKFDPHTHSTK